MKIVRRLLILLLTISPSAYSQEKTFKIGASLALTGPAAAFCIPVKNGIQLAIEELAVKSGNKIDAIYEDDHCEPKQTVTAVNKLLNLDKVDLIITCSSGTSKAVAPITEKKKTPHIAIATDPEVVRNKNYVVALWATPESETPLLMSEIKKRNYKTIARITAQHAGMLAFKNEFDKHNADKHVEIVLDDEVTEDSKDFRSFITRLKSTNNLDGIFVNLFIGSIGIFAKQAREMGIEAPIFGYEVFESKDDVKASKGAMYNSWYVQADEGTSGFIERYKRSFPNDETFAAANGYDAAALFISALESGNTDSKGIADFLHEIKDYKGALGTFSASGDNRFNLPVVIKVVKPEGFIKIN